jgi:hypothetical protein
LPLGTLSLAPLGQLSPGMERDAALAGVIQQLTERIMLEAAGEPGA